MQIKKLLISDNSTMYVEVVSYGARLHHIGHHAGHNVLVSPADVNDYRKDMNWMGATVGPRAHLLRDGIFKNNAGNLYYEKNYRGHHLHGGSDGFHRQNWRVEKHTNNILHLGLNTCEGDRFTIHYLISRNTLEITYTAKVQKTTLVNITNHAYFNLSAEDRIYKHRVKIDAKSVVDTDDHNLALPTVSPVTNNELDFNNSRQLSMLANIDEHFLLKKTRGYNHCYLLNKNTSACVEIEHPLQTDIFRILTTKPAIHFFTANNGQIISKRKPWQHSALCLEPVYPTSDYLKGEDAKSLLYPNQIYCETDTYQFINQ